MLSPYTLWTGLIETGPSMMVNSVHCQHSTGLMRIVKISFFERIFPGGEPTRSTVQRPRASCGQRYFTCQTSGRCITNHWVCDKERDCPDGSDELGCGNYANKL
jgi:hypothetical protein